MTEKRRIRNTMEMKVVKHANSARGREKRVRRGRVTKAEIEDMKMRGLGQL
jgi:hypothetical protein